MGVCTTGRQRLVGTPGKMVHMYTRADKVDKPEVKQVHLWYGERIDRDKISIVDVTVCGWINPPTEQISYNRELVTCDSCIRRSK